MGLLLFFFFKQKTAYEVRISDWSSDVCSSDLKSSRDALALLKQNSPAAAKLAPEAAAILVFPKIVKGGLIIGGQYGEGALFKNDAVSQYYSTAAASFGLQAGLQTFGYAIYFMNEKALSYLDNSDGWEIGTAPNVVVVDEGAGASLTTTSEIGRAHVCTPD